MNTKSLGYGLIGFGLVLMILNFYQLQVDLTLLLIGGCFLVAYFGNFIGSQKNIGFLIPGCILTALGLWEIVGSIPMFSQFEEVGFFASMGTAFLAVFVIGRYGKSNVTWAAIVATALYVFAVFVYLVTYSVFFSEHQDLIFPMVMILVGFVILIGSGISRVRRHK